MLTAYWVLECVNMLCNPTAALARTWENREACRTAVIENLNARPEVERFAWRCIPLPPRTAESLEQP